MDWHKKNHSSDGVWQGPIDSETWEHIERRWPKICVKPRNLKLNLTTNGVNQYSRFSSKYTIWPTCFVNYNLPPHLTSKRVIIMFNSILHGKGQVKNMDVYLKPLQVTS
jgi:hypothetical protein